MATYNQGILGSFKGKVGTVIGTFWKGRAVMRSRPQNVHNPRTEAQLAVRARMSLVSNFLSSVCAFVNEGYQLQAASEAITPSNVATRVNLAQAVTGSGTNVSLDYTHVQLAHGSLLGLKNPTVAVATSGHSVDIEWDNNSGDSPEASDSDKVMFCLCNPTKQASTYDLSTATRSNEASTLAYPAAWAGDTLYLYAAVRTTDKSNVSDSVLVGTVVAI